MERLPGPGLIPNLLMVAVLGTLALGCQKREETQVTTTPPAASTPAPGTPAATTAPAPAASASAVSVTRVELGNAVGADKRVTLPASTFTPKDTIHVSVGTRTGDAAATVPATLGAKWIHVDSNQTVREDSQRLELGGEGNTEFHIRNPDGWPTGRYRVEVSLDGRVVQTREFEVR